MLLTQDGRHSLPVGRTQPNRMGPVERRANYAVRLAPGEAQGRRGYYGRQGIVFPAPLWRTAMSANEDEYEYIYVAFVTTRNGKRIYAAAKGLRAFRIRVRKRR